MTGKTNQYVWILDVEYIGYAIKLIFIVFVY